MHRHLSLIFLLLAALGAAVTSCRGRVADRLDRAEALVGARPDSAAIILADIDYLTLDEDTRAQYILTKAQAHLLSSRSMVTDSLLPLAVARYTATGDTIRWLKANILYLHYLREMNRADEAIAILDDVIASLPADSIDRQYELRSMRLQMAMSAGRYSDAIAEAEWLMYHTVFPRARFMHAYFKMGILFLDGRRQQAAAWGDTVMRSDYMTTPDNAAWPEFMGDYAEILDECGQSGRAIEIVEDILRRNPGFTADAEVGFLASLAKYNANTGNLGAAMAYLDRIDSLDYDNGNVDVNADEYLEFLRNAITFKSTGHLYGTPDKKLKNELRLQTRINHDAVSEMNYLSARKMQLTIEKKNIAITALCVCLVLVIVASVLFGMLRRRRARLVEAGERIDTLNEMLRQVREARDDSKNAMLKKMVLQQMGILKTFAAAPTAQSQEALKKISATGTDGLADRLVDWDTLYTMVDELYDGFHRRLKQNFPGTFTEKETQIICLMKAGFTTKEIGFLTEQSSATIYVRKSAVRKKLSAADGADIIDAIESATV